MNVLFLFLITLMVNSLLETAKLRDEEEISLKILIMIFKCLDVLWYHLNFIIIIKIINKHTGAVCALGYCSVTIQKPYS